MFGYLVYGYSMCSTDVCLEATCIGVFGWDHRDTPYSFYLCNNLVTVTHDPPFKRIVAYTISEFINTKASPGSPHALAVVALQKFLFNEQVCLHILIMEKD